MFSNFDPHDEQRYVPLVNAYSTVIARESGRACIPETLMTEKPRRAGLPASRVTTVGYDGRSFSPNKKMPAIARRHFDLSR
jgi:hypothetical protein